MQQALQCPLLAAGAGASHAIAPALRRGRVHIPVWREGGATPDDEGGGAFFTVRTVNGQPRRVRRATWPARRPARRPAKR